MDDFIDYVLTHEKYRLMNSLLLKSNIDSFSCYRPVDVVEQQIAKRGWRVDFLQRTGKEPVISDELRMDTELALQRSDDDDRPSILQL